MIRSRTIRVRYRDHPAQTWFVRAILAIGGGFLSVCSLHSCAAHQSLTTYARPTAQQQLNAQRVHLPVGSHAVEGGVGSCDCYLYPVERP